MGQSKESKKLHAQMLHEISRQKHPFSQMMMRQCLETNGLGRTDQVSASCYQYISTTTELLCNKYTLQVGKKTFYNLDKYILQCLHIVGTRQIRCRPLVPVYSYWHTGPVHGQSLTETGIAALAGKNCT